MHDSFLLFKTIRLMILFNSQLEINLNNIEKIDYYPKRTNWLILLLPGFGGFQDTEYVFHLKNKKIISKKLYDNKYVVEKLNIELEKQVKLVYH